MRTHDIIVIGAGAGGLNIAGFMNKVGFRTLLIEREEGRIGGDCLNFGCVPSKALIHLAKLVHGARQAKEFGVGMTGEVSMAKVRSYIRSRIETIREHENADYFRGQGMDVIIGEARFTGKDSVCVGSEEYTAKNIVIATGSRPRRLDIEGSGNVHMVTNEEIFSLDKLPKELLVVGGGPIGIELGQAFQRLGSHVTVVQRGDRFLAKERKDISDILLERLKKEGMRFMFDAEPRRFEGRDTAIISAGGAGQKVRFDTVLTSIGRELDFSSLQVEMAGIEVEEGKIKVDRHLRTTNPHVYLCGDVAGSYQFTHATELHASVIITNLISPVRKSLDYDTFSWVTFTDPEIATFGLSEDEIGKRGIPYETLTYDFNDDDRSIVDDFRDGRMVLFLSRGKILGGSMIGENAGELCQELLLAMSSGLDVKHLFRKTYPYPTASRVNKRIISDHISQKLGTRTKKILRWLYG